MNTEQFVNLEERARTAISLGESHFREFKSVLHGEPGRKQIRESKLVCRDMSEALVAFANADGGELLVGVADSGEITGIETTSPAYVQLPRESPDHSRSPKDPLTSR